MEDDYIYILETVLLILTGAKDYDLVLKYNLGYYINKAKKIVEIINKK